VGNLDDFYEETGSEDVFGRFGGNHWRPPNELRNTAKTPQTGSKTRFFKVLLTVDSSEKPKRSIAD